MYKYDCNCDAVNNNGAACSSPSQCDSGYCVDGVCCNTACNNLTCQRCDEYSSGGAGTCGYSKYFPNYPATADLDNECTYIQCGTGDCKGNDYGCAYNTTGYGFYCPICTGCQGATSPSCVTYTNYAESYSQGGNTCGYYSPCQGCVSGSCVNIPDGQKDTYYSQQCTATHYRCDGSGSCTAPQTVYRYDNSCVWGTTGAYLYTSSLATCNSLCAGVGGTCNGPYYAESWGNSKSCAGVTWYDDYDPEGGEECCDPPVYYCSKYVYD